MDAEDWLAWGAANGIAPEVLFYIRMRPDLLHRFDPQEKAFCCPRTWEMVSGIVNRRAGPDPSVERALFRGTVGEAAAVEFSAFLKVWRELPHPRAVLDDPGNAVVPDNASALIALCGVLYRMADDITLDAIVTYAGRLRREVGEFLVGSCIRRPPALAGLHPLGRRTHAMTEYPAVRRLIHYPPGDAQLRRAGIRSRRRSEPPRMDPPITTARETTPMNLSHDAMLVSLRIAAWSGRLHDRQASTHVAVHHEASVSAGRYNKCLLPRTAFAALNATVSAARAAHDAQTLPWDDRGSRLLPVANHERYTGLMESLRERMVRERARFIEDYDDNIEKARLDLGKLFRIGDYPSKEALRDRFGLRWRIVPVPTISWRSSPPTTPTG